MEASTRYYLPKKGDSGWTVVFGKFNEARDRFLLAYEAVQGSRPENFTVVKHDPPVEDAGFYLAAAKATEQALADFPLDRPSYNTYVLPRADGQLYVYLLPATNAAGVYLLGGDIRYMFSAEWQYHPGQTPRAQNDRPRSTSPEAQGRQEDCRRPYARSYQLPRGQ